MDERVGSKDRGVRRRQTFFCEAGCRKACDPLHDRIAAWCKLLEYLAVLSGIY